jgi:hypothetical protein
MWRNATWGDWVIRKVPSIFLRNVSHHIYNLCFASDPLSKSLLIPYPNLNQAHLPRTDMATSPTVMAPRAVNTLYGLASRKGPSTKSEDRSLKAVYSWESVPFSHSKGKADQDTSRYRVENTNRQKRGFTVLRKALSNADTNSNTTEKSVS